jgi:RNA polymerase sigma-70 factor (ECF subfamily)
LSNTNPHEIKGLVAHLFRQQAGQLTATITRLLGASQLDLAEDVVQETLLRALRHWPFYGLPDSPAAWLTTTAKRIALDKLKHQSMQNRTSESVGRHVEEMLSQAAVNPDPKFNGELRDDLLAMMFACCRCDTSETTQIAMTLHLLCGFSAREVARAFLVDEAAVAQRLVRAKKSLRESGLSLDAPLDFEVASHLDTVLAALYGMFNEGYKASEGERLVREELCDEAIRLAEILVEHPAANRPETHALLSLCYFQHSRLTARVGADGSLLTLDEQDRSQWSRDDINHGLRYLELASIGERLTRYHLEAGIASVHATAGSYEQTNWERILELYDALLDIEPSPIVQLNRIVALSQAIGRVEAVAELDKIGESPRLKEYHLYYATRGVLLHQLDRREEARASFEEALRLCMNEVEKAFLRKKIAEL